MLGAWATQLKTALQPQQNLPRAAETQAMQSGGDTQILRDQRGLKEGVSHFGLKIRVEIAIGQILAGKK